MNSVGRKPKEFRESPTREGAVKSRSKFGGMRGLRKGNIGP